MATKIPTGQIVPSAKPLHKQFNRILKMIEPVLIEKYGTEEAYKLKAEALQMFADEIVDHIPYIGGKSNPYDRFMLQTTMALTVYRVIQNRGGQLEEAAEIIINGMTAVMENMPAFYLRLYGRWTNSKFRYPRLRKEAMISQERKYPDDWVYSFIEGDGESFDYGIDMHECGIMKYLEAQNAIEITPYLCAVDYITMYAMGIELKRTKTLAFGCDVCDFRFIVRGKPPKPTWPPVFPEKHCGK